MARISRRQFLFGSGALALGGLGVAARRSGRAWWERPPGDLVETLPPAPPGPWSIEARYYEAFAGMGSLNCASCHEDAEEPLPVSYCHPPHTGAYVRCTLCPQRCVIKDGERGLCRVICYSPDHSLTLAQMDAAAVRTVVDLWTDQYRELGSLTVWAVRSHQNTGRL